MAHVYVEAVRRAAVIAGGEHALALRLGVTPSHLALWIMGSEAPPAYVFLKVVDLITEHEITTISKHP
ncbi:MAG: hypothetical protein ACREUN_06530 [Burkholderiales bacterium]